MVQVGVESENGWRPAKVNQDACNWITVPGTNVSLQIQKSWPTICLRAWAADWNAHIEPLRDADSACWTPTNSVATSNHLNGTAIDLNWNSHPFRVRGSLNAQQMQTLSEMEDFYEDVVFWAGRWDDPVDEMHSQMGYGSWNNPHTGDFIRRKIRSDGFSTFRRGDVPVPPIPPENPSAETILAQATNIDGRRAAEILPMVRDGLRAADCTNVNRIAMWLAQIGHESGSFVYTEEIQDGNESTDRWLYKGRTWIQITWRTNYAGFSQWCFDRQLVSSPTYFVDHPYELAELKWAGLGAAWYWTVARSQINAMCDVRDLEGVTRAINGGLNGIDDRRSRYNRALAMGDQLLALSPTEPIGDEELTPEQDRMLREIHNGLFEQLPSTSRYGDPNLKWSVLQEIRNMDGFVFNNEDEKNAELGDTSSRQRILDCAARGNALAQAFLRKVKAQQNQTQDYPPQLPNPAPAPLPVSGTVTNFLPVSVPVSAPLPVSTSNNETTGQIIGQAYDALEKLRLADALPIESRAPLAALISVLQTKNGSNLGGS